MKITIALFFVLCINVVICQEESSPEYLILVNKAQDLLADKKYAEAGAMYSRALKLDPQGFHILSRYNAACSYAMAGVPDSAYVQLDFLVEKPRFIEFKKISKEKKLKPLHGTPRWDTLLAKVKRNLVANEEAFKKSQENQKRTLSFHDSLRGKAAVPFSCTDVNGKKYELNALKGKVIVFNFWATWCGPCKMEMPELNKVKDKFKGRDVVFISFCDNLDSVAMLNKSLSKNPFNYEMVIGEDARKLNKLYAVSSIPVNIVIDKKGIVSFLEAGYAPHVVTEMEHKIEKSLED